MLIPFLVDTLHSFPVVQGNAGGLIGSAAGLHPFTLRLGEIHRINHFLLRDTSKIRNLVEQATLFRFHFRVVTDKLFYPFARS